jgi:hypothetical protein
MSRFSFAAFWMAILLRIAISHGEETAWPPELRDARGGTVTIRSEGFLRIPASVAEARGKDGAAAFVVAKEPPTVELAYQRDLGENAVQRRLWSSWGDICLASDGSVYCGIGDHGNDVGGDARCFVYRWDPRRKVLEKVIDMNEVVPPGNGQPAWSKIHAKIDEGPDGKIYFSCTLNDGNRAKLPTHKWNDALPGGQLYQYDPATGKTVAFANLPPRRCTATSLLDRAGNIWWCNLEAGEGDALWGLNLKTKLPVFQAPDGSTAFNRAFALARDGSIYVNGEDGGLARFNPATRALTKTKNSFGDSPGMRCATRESKDGAIYGVTHKTNQLFRYRPAEDELTLLGPSWLAGSYTTVCELSSDERFLYYLPGAHGGAFRDGTPVIQYDIAAGRQKVLAFLAPAIEEAYGYVPAGTYGAKISADGGTLYVNFNGHAADAIRPAHMKPIGFGLCAFAAIQIPASER